MNFLKNNFLIPCAFFIIGACDVSCTNKNSIPSVRNTIKYKEVEVYLLGYYCGERVEIFSGEESIFDKKIFGNDSVASGGIVVLSFKENESIEIQIFHRQRHLKKTIEWSSINQKLVVSFNESEDMLNLQWVKEPPLLD